MTDPDTFDAADCEGSLGKTFYQILPASGPSPPYPPPPPPPPTPTCHDLDLAGTLLDVDGDNCAFYTANPLFCTDWYSTDWLYDDYLKPSAMCCACGGGALMSPSTPPPPAPRPPLVQCDYYSHSTTNDPNEAYGPLYQGTSVSNGADGGALIGDLQYAKDACTEHSECDAFSTQQIDASLSNYRKIWLKKVRGDAGDAEGLETWLSGNTWQRNTNWNFYYANELCSKVSPPPSPTPPCYMGEYWRRNLAHYVEPCDDDGTGFGDGDGDGGGGTGGYSRRLAAAVQTRKKSERVFNKKG
jgi:hypothetical protein